MHRARHSLDDDRAFLASVGKQATLNRDRFPYGKFLSSAATHYRHAFGTAVTLAIMGYHFQKITDRVCRVEYELTSGAAL